MNLESLLRHITDHLNRSGRAVWINSDTIKLLYNTINDDETIKFPNLKAELHNYLEKFYLENFKIVDV